MKFSNSYAAVFISLLLANPALKAGAQDAFDSTCEYTGTQTQTYTGDSFDSGDAPQLQGETFGTVGEKDDYEISNGDIRLRSLLIKPVNCSEPEVPGMFPPMPQVVSLPEDTQDPDIFEPKNQDKKAGKYFDRARKFASHGHLTLAAKEFDGAMKKSSDEQGMIERISTELSKLATNEKKSRLRADLLRLALFYDSSNKEISSLLNHELLEQDQDPYNLDFRISLAENFENQADYQLAAAEWQAVVKIKNSCENRSRLANALIEAGSDRQAIVELRKIVNSNWPDANKLKLSTAHCLLAKLFLENSRYFAARAATETRFILLENASMDARRAVTLNPRNKEAVNLLIRCASEAVNNMPHEANNHMMLAAGHLIKGDLGRAEVEYNECKRCSPDDQRLSAAQIVFQTASADPSVLLSGKLKDSIARVQELLDQEPKNDQLWRFLGRLFEQSQDPDRARSCFKHADAIYWSDPNSL
ncbi:MAG: hypothetical protein K2X27_02010 [Candidatus Obscuribacterales bacterium]|nr:hypothetical protein [Candidatus Obscuribacterales bacterium]